MTRSSGDAWRTRPPATRSRGAESSGLLQIGHVDPASSGVATVHEQSLRQSLLPDRA